MSHHRRTSITRLSVLLLSLVLGVSGCIPVAPEADITAGVSVTNNTDRTLRFRILRENGEWSDLGTVVEPSVTMQVIGRTIVGEHSLIGEDDCTSGPIEALDARGNLVAMHPPGLCVDDVWVIDE